MVQLLELYILCGIWFILEEERLVVPVLGLCLADWKIIREVKMM